MSEEAERWIPASTAVERVANRLNGATVRAVDRLAGWFFDNRVRFKAAEAIHLMPQEYLDEPYFDSTDYEEQGRFRELYGHTHSEDDLKRREREDEIIDPTFMSAEAIDSTSPLWREGELQLRFEALNPEARVSFYGVTVNERELEKCMALLPEVRDKTDGPRSISNMKPTPVGRPPASWWPDFAAELAIAIHEGGLPTSQAALIERVQQALVLKGREEPSRAAIQKVIREVFARLGQP